MPATIKAHRASRVIVKKDTKKVAKILAGHKKAAFESHMFVTKMTQILAAKQQGLPAKDHMVVKSSKHAQRAAAFRRKQKEDGKQSMLVLSNKPCVGPTEAEVNEWFEDKRERQEEAKYIHQAFKVWHKFSSDEQPPLNSFMCQYLLCVSCNANVVRAAFRLFGKDFQKYLTELRPRDLAFGQEYNIAHL
ncbi:unnamed protein product [Cylindrotheca closterium]|uniref:Uncharacterized protein n=1 Tax=Cylindrotheca closterium TaxID=2856 RepID=A0AAD2FHV1_9STRA|nr:unnamed protein product [Cylindrotheca closterium]